MRTRAVLLVGLGAGLPALQACERAGQTEAPSAEPDRGERRASKRASAKRVDALGCAQARMPERGEDPPVADRPREETHALARRAALRWREEAGDLQAFCIDDPDRFELVEREAWPCKGGPARAEAWTIRGRGLELRLTFSCSDPPEGDAPPSGEASAYLDHFWPYEPVPDWGMSLQTPSSSVDGEVRVRASGDGEFEATIAAPIYAVYGHSATEACEPIADAGSEEGCFVSIERRLVLELTIRLPTIPARVTGP